MGKKLLIFGAGQYGQLAREIALATDSFDQISFLDDNNPTAIGRLEDFASYLPKYDYAFIAIGNAEVRARWLGRLQAEGYPLATLISPSAYVSPSATVGEGCIVEPTSVVHTGAVLGACTFVCAGSVVNHNATVGACCQINCGAVVGARATLPGKTKVDYLETYSAQNN